MLPDPVASENALCDVLVVGGGPAGSTIAALLAERGRHVVLLEKDKHPRFHIGESLLPLNLPLLEQLGLKGAIEGIGMVKHGAEFVSPYHHKAVTFEFAKAWDKRFPHAYQVRRSEFDRILLDNARAKGAEVIEECRVSEIEFPPGGGAVARAETAAGAARRWQARFVVDATGRDTLLANQLGLKRRNRKHNTAAMFGHFTDAKRLPGKEVGNISIFWFDYGWFWFIPLQDGTTSVGAVCPANYFKSRQGDLASFFMRTIAECPEIAARLEPAKLVSAVTATGNYSYSATRMTGKDFILLGDAYAFIDPVFSTGVYLAMKSAFLGADAVADCLDRPRHAAGALKRFEAEMRRGLASFRWYIYHVRMPAFRDMYMASRKKPAIEEAVLSLMAGDVFGDAPIKPRLTIFKTIYYLLTGAYAIPGLGKRIMNR